MPEGAKTRILRTAALALGRHTHTASSLSIQYSDVSKAKMGKMTASNKLHRGRTLWSKHLAHLMTGCALGNALNTVRSKAFPSPSSLCLIHFHPFILILLFNAAFSPIPLSLQRLHLSNPMHRPDNRSRVKSAICNCDKPISSMSVTVCVNPSGQNKVFFYTRSRLSRSVFFERRVPRGSAWVEEV